MNKIDRVLADAAAAGASDVLIRSGSQIHIRVAGLLRTLSVGIVTESEIRNIMQEVLPRPASLEQFERDRELDFSYQPESVPDRYRVNLYFHRGSPGIALRRIPADIPSLDQLGFGPVLRSLINEPQGLILITGPTGSGKSTTLAAMVDEINTSKALHIISIEDPIEFIHRDKMCVVDQREIGQDTLSFYEALRRSLRQDPDVIVVGEMRDPDTIAIAMTAAETGHLVLSTLHTNDAKQSIERIINSFPMDEHHQVRMKLALSLRGIVAQRLLPKKGFPGKRVAVQEIMINSPTVKRLIECGETSKLDKVIEDARAHLNMQSLNQSLYDALESGLINETDALAISTNPSDLRVMLQTRHFQTSIHRDGKSMPTGWAINPATDN